MLWTLNYDDLTKWIPLGQEDKNAKEFYYIKVPEDIKYSIDLETLSTDLDTLCIEHDTKADTITIRPEYISGQHEPIIVLLGHGEIEVKSFEYDSAIGYHMVTESYEMGSPSKCKFCPGVIDTIINICVSRRSAKKPLR